MHRERQCNQVTACSERARRKSGEIGPAGSGKIRVRYYAGIDPKFELAECLECGGPEAISTRFVDCWPMAERILDPIRKPRDLLAFESWREVSGEGVIYVDVLVNGQGDPRM